MPKMRTRSSAKKRFKVTAGGHLKRAKSLKRHILTKKGPKRKRQLRKGMMVSKCFEKQLRTMLDP
jgi:large subunit ribosomal protein L35